MERWSGRAWSFLEGITPTLLYSITPIPPRLRLQFLIDEIRLNHRPDRKNENNRDRT
jgi:hypothetical protein